MNRAHGAHNAYPLARGEARALSVWLKSLQLPGERQGHVARRLGVNIGTIAKLFPGVASTPTSTPTLDAIAARAGVTREQLLAGRAQPGIYIDGDGWEVDVRMLAKIRSVVEARREEAAALE